MRAPTGFALPIQRNERDRGWDSSAGEFRRREMFLIPGSSPMGFRLPLESLPWVAPEKRPLAAERSTFEEATPLEDISPIVFLGQQVAEKHPVIREWRPQSPADVPLDPQHRRIGDAQRAARPDPALLRRRDRAKNVVGVEENQFA